MDEARYRLRKAVKFLTKSAGSTSKTVDVMQRTRQRERARESRLSYSMFAFLVFLGVFGGRRRI